MADKQSPQRQQDKSRSGDHVGNKRAGYTGPSNPKPPTNQQVPKNPPKQTGK